MTRHGNVSALVVAFAAAMFCFSHVYGVGGDDNDSPGPAVDPGVARAKQAIDGQNWNEAVKLLTQAASRDERNPDIYNYLGYAERNLGNFDSAFKYYEQALSLDPKHRGAHEYLGETYLLVGNIVKAEEHLATLDKLCFFSCKEFSELKEKILAYKQKQRTSTN